MLSSVILMLFITFCIFVVLISFVSWFAHISMTKNYCNNCGWGSYKEFVEQFTQCKLRKNKHHAYSFRNSNTNSQFSNSIIKFHGKGMLLYPIAWLRANAYVRITTKQPIGKFKDL